MSILNWYRNLGKGVKNDQEIAEEGLCPNCWGSQEYDGKFVQAIRDKQIDVNNGEATRAFIQDFVSTHVQPIKLQNRDVYDQCPICKVKYSKSS
ncbi:MAG: hypothetical protein ACPGTP_01080 [Bacteroidia bacterium]